MAQTKEDIKELKDKAVLAAETLYHITLIARSIGRDEATIHRWKQDDPDFASRLKMGQVAFVKKQMGRAKPDFLLERLERDIFGQKVTIEGGENPIAVLLKEYGLTGGDHDGQDDGSVSGTSSSDS